MQYVWLSNYFLSREIRTTDDVIFYESFDLLSSLFKALLFAKKKKSFPLHSCTTTITSYNRPQQRHITCVFLRRSWCFSKQFLCSLLECTLSLQLIKTEAYNPGANIALGWGGGGSCYLGCLHWCYCHFKLCIWGNLPAPTPGPIKTVDPPNDPGGTDDSTAGSRGFQFVVRQ